MDGDNAVLQLVRDAIEYAQRGDRAALEKVFEELYELKKDYAYRITFSILQNEDDALDATQETFYKVWRGLKGIREPGKFEPWLGTIARNAAKDALKERNRLAWILINDDDELINNIFDNSPDAKPYEHVLGNELRGIVDGVLQYLIPRERKVWKLHEQGCTHSEIATSGIPIGTVK